MIIIEGTDLTGKTTLAEMLCKEYDAEYVHLGLPASGKRHWDELVEALKPNAYGPRRVFDRACLGSVIYGAIKYDAANSQPVTRNELLKFKNFCWSTGTPIIHATASRLTIAQRYKSRGDQYLSLNEILLARSMYIELFHEAIPNFVYLSSDYTAIREWTKSLHQVLDACMNLEWSPTAVENELRSL